MLHFLQQIGRFTELSDQLLFSKTACKLYVSWLEDHRLQRTPQRDLRAGLVQQGSVQPRSTDIRVLSMCSLAVTITSSPTYLEVYPKGGFDQEGVLAKVHLVRRWGWPHQDPLRYVDDGVAEGGRGGSCQEGAVAQEK